MSNGTITDDDRDEFWTIGKNGSIVLSTRKDGCDCCENHIPREERMLQLEVIVEGSFPMPINVCKNCIKLAAKRLGVMR